MDKLSPRVVIMLCGALGAGAILLSGCSEASAGPGCQEFLDAGRGSPKAFELLGDAYFVKNPDQESVAGTQLFPLMGAAVSGCTSDPASHVADHIG